MSTKGEISASHDESFEGSEDAVSSAGSDYTPEWDDKIKKKAKYQIITQKKRQKLVDLVQQKGISISKAAKRIGIKYSSAKTIYATYVKEGRVSIKPKSNLSETAPKFSIPKKKQQTNEKIGSDNLQEEPPKKINTRRLKKEPKSKKSETPPSKSEHCGKSSLICNIRELNSSEKFSEPSLMKRVKKEEIEPRQVSLPATPVKIEAETKRPENIMSRPSKFDSIGNDPFIENKLLLTQLSSLIGAGRPVNPFQNQILNPLVNENLLRMNTSPVRMDMSPIRMDVSPIQLNTLPIRVATSPRAIPLLPVEANPSVALRLASLNNQKQLQQQRMSNPNFLNVPRRNFLG